METQGITLSIGDTVKVVANVDNIGQTGKITSLTHDGTYPIKVQFDDTWACYFTNELEKTQP